MKCEGKRWLAVVGLTSFFAISLAVRAEPARNIVIDGKFDDWAGIPVHTDPPGNTHDTSHKLKDDKPEPVDHPDVDILEYKFAHDADNLYGYYKARGAMGRTQVAADGKPAGRYYAVITIDTDNDDKTGYWIHEGGYYPTSRGYDVNAEIEWYNGHFNTGHYLNHACLNEAELDQAFLDQSSGKYQKGKDGPYRPGFMRMGPGTYRYYTGWVYHADGTITFVKDKGPRYEGIVRGAVSADGHELEMVMPMKGFLAEKSGKPIVALGRTINISMSLEASGELAPAGKWASNTAAPIRGYVLQAPKE